MNNNYKNIFMFKNPLRHFLNAENLIYPTFNIDISDLDNVDWTKPITFSIRKYYGQTQVRTLSIPNYLNFNLLYEHCKKMDNFYDFEKIGKSHSRIKVNLETGDFKAYEYQRNVENDLHKLTLYDTLYRFDIKSFYKSIYTHELVEFTPFNNSQYNNNDRFITGINYGKTAGIMMGNYISLYLIEFMLNKIMSELKQRLNDKKIVSVVNNFSDDIYVFSFANKKSEIEEIVRSTLEKYDLELNDNKTNKYSYLEYNNENIITKLWKRVISKQKKHEIYIDSLNDKKAEGEEIKYYMNFTNQLIYRLSEIEDSKNRAIFIKNFFKSDYFLKLDISKYKITKENIHHLKFIMSEWPETILYIIPKMRCVNQFQKFVTQWFDNKFVMSLEKKFHEEQLYYIFAINSIKNYDPITFPKEIFEKIMESNNQILKAYAIMYNMESTIDCTKYLIGNEQNWFLNYHILLKKNDITTLDDDIDKYLIPESIKQKVSAGKPTGSIKQKFYHDFYKKNIVSDIPLIKKYEEVEHEINEYLKMKSNERRR